MRPHHTQPIQVTFKEAYEILNLPLDGSKSAKKTVIRCLEDMKQKGLVEYFEVVDSHEFRVKTKPLLNDDCMELTQNDEGNLL